MLPSGSLLQPRPLLKASKAILAAAAAKSDAADSKALTSAARSIASAKMTDTVAAKSVAATQAQVQTTTAVATEQAKVVLASDKAVAVQEIVIVKIDTTVQQIREDLAKAEGAKEDALRKNLEASLAKKKAEAIELLELEKKKQIQAKLLEQDRLKLLQAAQLAQLEKTKQAIAAEKAAATKESAESLKKRLQATRP
jgi:hypothetical protein